MVLAHGPVAGPDALHDGGHGHVVGLPAILKQPIQVLQRLCVYMGEAARGVRECEVGEEKDGSVYLVKLQLAHRLVVPESLR